MHCAMGRPQRRRVRAPHPRAQDLPYRRNNRLVHACPGDPDGQHPQHRARPSRCHSMGAASFPRPPFVRSQPERSHPSAPPPMPAPSPPAPTPHERQPRQARARQLLTSQLATPKPQRKPTSSPCTTSPTTTTPLFDLSHHYPTPLGTRLPTTPFFPPFHPRRRVTSWSEHEAGLHQPCAGGRNVARRDSVPPGRNMRPSPIAEARKRNDAMHRVQPDPG